MQFNECSHCKAKDGCCGNTFDDLCLNCYDTQNRQEFTIHTHLVRTSKQLERTGKLIMTTVNRDTLVRKIKGTKGKIFSVRFKKKDGEMRDMNCRLGVKKFLTGSGRSKGTLPNLITVYDLQVQGYRCFDKSRIQSAVIGGTAYTL